MHADEIEITPELVGELLADQFPGWASLPLARVVSPGTDNAIFRLGSDMAVRLPRIHWAAADAEKEFRWLPHVAPHLPVRVPVPLALGEPGSGYPWRWTVTRWLPGTSAYETPFTSLAAAAVDLAGVIAAMRLIDSGDGPPAAAPAANRGYPIRQRDGDVAEALSRLGDEVDAGAVLKAWDEVLDAPDWDRAPVWIHGDLQPTNMIVEDDRLTGILDFGGLGVGDPAVDLIPAWSMLDESSRTVFRERLAVDEPTWMRGRGWALSVGLVALPYYLRTNPVIVAWSRTSIEEVIGSTGK
jgi:aminoglycoside phosphotransferase (APT) family kinase protein